VREGEGRGEKAGDAHLRGEAAREAAQIGVDIVLGVFLDHIESVDELTAAVEARLER
jgi:hypothetical protein